MSPSVSCVEVVAVVLVGLDDVNDVEGHAGGQMCSQNRSWDDEVGV